MKMLDAKGNTVEVIDVYQAVNEIKEIVKENPFFQYPLYYLCDCDELTGTDDECYIWLIVLRFFIYILLEPNQCQT